jgi:hypothetical protein
MFIILLAEVNSLLRTQRRRAWRRWWRNKAGGHITLGEVLTLREVLLLRLLLLLLLLMLLLLLSLMLCR